MSNLNKFVEEKIMPLAGKISENKVINSITAGMMATLPLTLGTCLIAIAVGFPIPAWLSWLAATGIDVHLKAIISGTTEITGLFITFTIAYKYANSKGADGITAGVLSLATFLSLMPQSIQLGDGKTVAAFLKTNLGSGGLFVGMIIAILITSLYCYLNKKGLVIKLPPSVPEMVSKSLGPTFIAVIIFCIVALVRIGFGSTLFGDLFNFINTIITKPIMSMGATPLSAIIVFTVANLLWWFGVHPSTICGPYIFTVLAASGIANIGAFQAGQPMPYLVLAALGTFLSLGGQGNTLGLAINMVLFAKSKHYKALGKLSIVPSIFAINEPLIFGAPIIFNPLYLIPMTISSIVTGLIGWIFVNLGAYNSFNPTIGLPWTMPVPITALLTAGIMACIAVCCAIAASAVLYYPFFKMADKKALKEEQSKEV